MADIEKIYSEYMPQVYRYLFSLCHDSNLAEELTQETFFQALKSIGNFRGDCKLYVWLCQIAKHVWIKDLKRRKREDTYEHSQEKLVSSDSPEAHVLRKEQMMDMYKLLHELNERMREVMYLRIDGNFSFREIGEIMGKDENWARVTYYRGKLQLRRESDEM